MQAVHWPQWGVTGSAGGKAKSMKSTPKKKHRPRVALKHQGVFSSPSQPAAAGQFGL